MFFAVDVDHLPNVVSPELKQAGNVLVKFTMKKDEYDLPDYGQVMAMYDKITEMIHSGLIQSAYAIGFGGICEAVSKMAFGNGLGAVMDDGLTIDDLFAKEYGSIIAEVPADRLGDITTEYTKIALVTEQPNFVIGSEKIAMKEALEAWTGTLESVFATRSDVEQKELEDKVFDAGKVYTAANKIAKPKVFIPVLNCS